MMSPLYKTFRRIISRWCKTNIAKSSFFVPILLFCEKSRLGTRNLRLVSPIALEEERYNEKIVQLRFNRLFQPAQMYSY
jgi:hypothetical protein